MATTQTTEPWNVDGATLFTGDCERKYFAEFDNEEDARRAAACVNACAGISTENLEQNKPLKEGLHGLNARIRNVEQQRDELLTELALAHKIICNALNSMDISAKLEWGAKNKKEGCNGEGTTRANEREALITKVKGGAT